MSRTVGVSVAADGPNRQVDFRKDDTMNDKPRKLSDDDWLDAIDELSKLSTEEKDAMVRAFVKEDLADRVRRGELVVVATAPDGTPTHYQKACKLEAGKRPQ